MSWCLSGLYKGIEKVLWLILGAEEVFDSGSLGFGV